jgi:hypothetical protein
MQDAESTESLATVKNVSITSSKEVTTMNKQPCIIITTDDFNELKRVVAIERTSVLNQVRTPDGWAAVIKCDDEVLGVYPDSYWHTEAYYLKPSKVYYLDSDRVLYLLSPHNTKTLGHLTFCSNPDNREWMFRDANYAWELSK